MSKFIDNLGNNREYSNDNTSPKFLMQYITIINTSENDVSYYEGRKHTRNVRNYSVNSYSESF